MNRKVEGLRSLENKLMPISREELARCVEQELGDSDLAEQIRRDTSFDLVTVNTAHIDEMEVDFHIYDGILPKNEAICGNVVELALKELPYNKRKWNQFTSSIRLKQDNF